MSDSIEDFAARPRSAWLPLLARGLGRLQPDRRVLNLLRSMRHRHRAAGHYNILGMCSTGHGASFALVSSKYGIRALNFERFVGRKYALLLAREELREIEQRLGPIASGIRFMLSNRDGTLPPAFAFEEYWQPFLRHLLRGLPMDAADIDYVVASESHFALNRAWLGRSLSHLFPNAVVTTSLEHHTIHQAQAFLASGFADAAILTADSSGETLSRMEGAALAMTLAHGDPRGVKVFVEHRAPESSPGNLYGFVNEYLGFDNGEEGKTMGLSSFGRDVCYKQMRPHLTLHSNGAFNFLDRAALTDMLGSMGIDRREPSEPIRSQHEDLAYGVQRLLDDIMVNAVKALERWSSSANLCIAGGTALNSVSNQIAFQSSRFKQVYVMPNAGDCGHALGCALHTEQILLRRNGITKGRAAVGMPPLHTTDALGPPYTDTEIESALAEAGLTARKVDNVAEQAAALIAEGLIVGWFQGGSEFGPRSLGQRSILADPRSAAMRDHLNARVKLREPFRPFAPAVLQECASAFFALEGSAPFMLRVVDVLAPQRSVIPAVTHVDGTARVQTVDATATPRFHALISAFARLTGVPVVLNTSFNVAGKPIVETPRDAIDCYLSTQIDALVLHDYLLMKPTEDGRGSS